MTRIMGRSLGIRRILRHLANGLPTCRTGGVYAQPLINAFLMEEMLTAQLPGALPEDHLVEADRAHHRLPVRHVLLSNGHHRYGINDILRCSLREQGGLDGKYRAARGSHLRPPRIMQPCQDADEARQAEAEHWYQQNSDNTRCAYLQIHDDEVGEAQVVDGRVGLRAAAVVVIAEQPHVAHHKPYQRKCLKSVSYADSFDECLVVGLQVSPPELDVEDDGRVCHHAQDGHQRPPPPSSHISLIACMVSLPVQCQHDHACEYLRDVGQQDDDHSRPRRRDLGQAGIDNGWIVRIGIVGSGVCSISLQQMQQPAGQCGRQGKSA